MVALEYSMQRCAPACRCATALALFSRANLAKPTALIPTVTSASTCVRFCPVFFARVRTTGSPGSGKENDNQQHDVENAGRLASNADDNVNNTSPFQLSYKLVYAVGTTDSILLFDTGAPSWWSMQQAGTSVELLSSNSRSSR